MKTFLAKLLNFLSKLILNKYNPVVIGITGSVGKTSAKQAIFAVLSSKFSVRASIKNYNNELGVPFTIIGVASPGKNIFKWIWIFKKALLMIIFPFRYPRILIIEMGADHPGDIEKLVKLTKPAIGVVTAVDNVHTEFFKNIEGVALEKGKLASGILKTLILNADDKIVSGFKGGKEIITYGIDNKADIQGSGVVESLVNGVDEYGSVRFDVEHDGEMVSMHLSNVVGLGHVYAALAAVAVGVSLGMSMKEISSALIKYNSAPGRMRLIPGVKNTFIIDDTYNSSPRAALAALTSLGRLGTGKKYAVLADMLELGDYSEQGHREVGRMAAKCSDVLVVVGKNVEWIFDEAIESGMDESSVFHFHNLEEGVEQFLQDCLCPGDVLLIKGSQGMRMEKLVKGLMGDPLKAKDLLCRQGQEWGV